MRRLLWVVRMRWWYWTYYGKNHYPWSKTFDLYDDRVAGLTYLHERALDRIWAY